MGGAQAGTQLYAYDEQGRPLGVYTPDASEPTGLRVVEEYVHLDGWRSVAVVRPSAISGMVNPDIHPVLTDHLGTPRKVLDASTGQTRWEWDAKEPFGHQAPNQIPTAGLPAFTLDLRFPGQRYDEATGLFQNGFRDYHSGLGRYVQSDPLGLEAGWNTYGYVGANPQSQVDPYGLWFGVDDAVFSGGGALIGLAGRAVTDAFSGSISPWEDYVGSAIGGAVSGEILLYTANPFLAGAGGSLAGNLSSQGLKILTGKQCEMDFGSAMFDTSVGAATGFIPGRVIPGINKGRGSSIQVFRQMRTKAINGTASSIKPRTAVKMARGAFQEYAFMMGLGTGPVSSRVYETIANEE